MSFSAILPARPTSREVACFKRNFIVRRYSISTNVFHKQLIMVEAIGARSRQEAKVRGRPTTAASEHLRRMLEDSLRLDDAVERLERLEHATDMLLRTLDRVVGRRSLPFPLKLQMETVEQLLDVR